MVDFEILSKHLGAVLLQFVSWTSFTKLLDLYRSGLDVVGLCDGC
jgi:hypothetical protein